MATIKELSARLAATGQLTAEEITAFNAATGPNATAEAQEKALETLVSKLEKKSAGASVTAPVAPAPVTQPVQAATGQPTSQQAQAQAPTEAEWLANAPAKVRELVQRAAAQDFAHKTALIARINSATTIQAGGAVFTEDELKAMSVENLQKLVALAGVNNSNSGVNVPNPADPNATLGTLGTLGYDWSGAGAMFPDVPRTAAIMEVMDPYEEALKEQRANRKAN